MASDRFKRPLTAQEAVLAELRRNILTGQWPPGAPIRQDTVAAELGVSRVPVREALKILEGEGQVTYAPHKGYSVTQFDGSELEEIYRMREILEAEAVVHAIPNLTDEDLERMLDAIEAMEALRPSDVNALMDENRRFHLTMLDAADRPKLQHFIRLLRDSSDPYRAMLYMDWEALQEAHAEHRAMYEACVAGDADRVIELLRAHRSHTVDRVGSVLST